MSDETLYKKRVAKLVRILGLQPDEDLIKIVRRGLATSDKVNEEWSKVFIFYYGLASALGNRYSRHYAAPPTQKEILFLHSATCIAEEVLETMRAEQALPNQHILWNPLAFFTVERGLGVEVSPKSVGIIRFTLGLDQYKDISQLVSRNTKEDLLRTPGLAAVTVSGMERMLSTAGIYFSG